MIAYKRLLDLHPCSVGQEEASDGKACGFIGIGRFSLFTYAAKVAHCFPCTMHPPSAAPCLPHGCWAPFACVFAGALAGTIPVYLEQFLSQTVLCRLVNGPGPSSHTLTPLPGNPAAQTEWMWKVSVSTSQLADTPGCGSLHWFAGACLLSEQMD